MGREWKYPIPKIREREGKEKNPFPKSGNGKGMKKSIPKVRERESEASILGNDWEWEREWNKKLQWLKPIENVVKFSENKTISDKVHKDTKFC